MRSVRQLASGWEFTGGPLKEWLPAQVPGHVHTDLQRVGVIGDPFYRMNEAGVQWVDEANWSYRCSFEWSPSDLTRQLLHFRGLDTVCKVLLNGETIAENDNMFVPLDVEVTGKLKEGTNELQVDFQSAVVVGRERRAKYFAEQGLGDQIVGFDEVPFVRKAQYMSGWDWGPRLVSCGLWQPAELIEETSDHVEPEVLAAAPVARLVREKDAIGESFSFVKDGKTIWVRGANWIPDHSFPSLVTRERVREKVRLAKELGFNMLRIWGGGLYETDDFYEACEEYGMMVWQDFPFACSYYPENPEFIAAFEREAVAAIKRLRRYSCLVLWCGNNENHQMFYQGWQKGDARPPYFYGVKIYEEVIPRLLAEHDPGRDYIPSSPIGGDVPNADGFGDVHNWDVWHGRGDWRYYSESKARFSSEYGFAAAPSQYTFNKVASPEDQNSRSPVARWHDKTRKGTETFIGFVELHYPPAEDLEDWIYTSQLNQRDALRLGVEHLRRGDFCTGSLIWQFNDCWPVQSWAILDSESRPKALAYELKRIYADFLVSIERANQTVRVHGINDGPGLWAANLTLEARSLHDGSLLREWSADLRLAAGQREALISADLGGLNINETLLWARAGGQTAWALLNEPKLVSLPAPGPIKASVADGANLVLETTTPVVDLMLTDDAGDPLPFKANFITRPEPGAIVVPLASVPSGLRLRSLAGRHPVQWVWGP